MGDRSQTEPSGPGRAPAEGEGKMTGTGRMTLDIRRSQRASGNAECWKNGPGNRSQAKPNNPSDLPAIAMATENERPAETSRRGQGEDEVNAAVNNDKSPLINLISCVACDETMKLEKSSHDAEGKHMIQYRCGRCDRIELVRLFRRSRDSTT